MSGPSQAKERKKEKKLGVRWQWVSAVDVAVAQAKWIKFDGVCKHSYDSPPTQHTHTHTHTRTHNLPLTAAPVSGSMIRAVDSMNKTITIVSVRLTTSNAECANELKLKRETRETLPVVNA